MAKVGMCGSKDAKFGSVDVSDKNDNDERIFPLTWFLKHHITMELMSMGMRVGRRGQRVGHIKMRGVSRPQKLGMVHVPSPSCL